MRKKHISAEIFTYTSAGFLLIILLLCGGFLIYQKNILQEKINVSITGILNQTSNAVNAKLERAESMSRYFKMNTTLISVLKNAPGYEDTKAVYKLFGDMSNSRLETEEYITIVGKNGHVFVNWENDGNRKYSDSIKALNARILDESDVLHGVIFEKLVGYENPDQFNKHKRLMGMASFIYDNVNIEDIIGIITVNIPEKSVLEVMEGNKIFAESKTCIIDRRGQVLLTGDHDLTGTVIDIDMDRKSQGGSMLEAGNQMITYQGSQMMAFYQHLDFEWTQVVLIPYHIYMKEIRMMAMVFVGLAVFAIFLAMTISMVISYSISKPIKELEHSMDLITHGDLNHRVSVTRADDIGRLSTHFNVMADNLEHLIEEKIEIQKRTSQLEIANKTAELKMLHAQINPHFLFNTLNSIRCLALINKVEYIAHMLESLGALLENSIMKGQENTSIGREITLLNKYIELQQMRYGKRLKAEFQVEESILGSEIPKFMLQPLVENAIMHGVTDKVEGGTIIIRGRRLGETIRLEVEDDGGGFDKTKRVPSSAGHGIGLSNIRERLLLIYGEGCDLKITSGSEGRGTLVVFEIPEHPYKEVKS